MDTAVFVVTTVTAMFVAGYYYMQSRIKYLKDNWSKIRCDPLYMPFAGFVGVSVASNFSKCVGKSFSDMSAFSNDGLFANLSVVSDSMENIGGAVSDLRGLVGNVRGGFMMVFQMVFGKIANLMGSMQYLMIRIRTLMGRIVGVFASIIYSFTTGMETGEAVMAGPIGKVISIF
jgi:hypothetical protein